jgi:DNA-binding transcriptional LysR family regulator
MINPVWLRSYCTLVDVGHFTRTAERLHMTQSGVSQHIQKLEEYLDVSLLLRDGKQFELTQAGQRLYDESNSIIQALTELEERVRDDPPFAGHIRMMSPGSVGLRLYPKLLELQQSHRKLIVNYRFAPNHDVERALLENRADIGLMTEPSTLVDVHCETLGEEPLRLVTPAFIADPEWRLLEQLGFIEHPDGAHHATLLLGENYPEFQHIDLLDKTGFSNQINLILEPVAHGLGFTVLPAYAVKAFHNQKSVKVHQLKKTVSEPLYLATRGKSFLPSRIQTVIDMCKQWI